MNLLHRIVNIFTANEEFYSSELAAKYCRQSKQFLNKSEAELKAAKLELNQCLNGIQDQVAKLRKITRKHLRGDTYFDGQAISMTCHSLYLSLEGKNLEHEAALAAKLWASCACGFNGHYITAVAPAMIAHAQTSESIGNSDRALKLYEHLVSDLMKGFHRYEKVPYLPVDEDYLNTVYLKTSIERVKSLALEIYNKYEGLECRVNKVLSREKDPGWIEGPVKVDVKPNGRIKCPRCDWSIKYRKNEKHCLSCNLERIID